MRAGVLEQGTVELLRRGVGERLRREGIIHHGIELSSTASGHRIDLERPHRRPRDHIYGQQEVVKDLIAARLGRPAAAYSRPRTSACTSSSDRRTSATRTDGEEHELDCDVVAGCDGFHGVCRAGSGRRAARLRARLPVRLARDPRRGRRPRRRADLRQPRARLRAAQHALARAQRLYLQCAPDEDIAVWPDERIWEELHIRLGSTAGRSARARSREGRHADAQLRGRADAARAAFLAGDAAHIVPPTGAKGLNLAVADVRRARRALDRVVSRRATTAARRLFRRPACAGSGGPSTSPGG